jgi:hypothetical protein
MDLADVDDRLRVIVGTIPAPVRAYVLDVLTADPASRAAAIGDLHGSGIGPATVELLIDAEADPATRAVLVGLLREAR